MAAITTPFTISSLAALLGVGGSASAIAAAAINECSPVTPDQTVPWDALSWVGYDHAALPPAPVNFAGNPGISFSPAGETEQDSHVWMGWDPNCADSYDVGKGPTGGPYSVVSNSQAGVNYAHNIGTPETDGYFVVRGNSLDDDPGSWSSEIHLRTCPTSPKSPGTSDDANCSNLTITLSWGNGSSPGVRNSIVKWRVQKNGGGFGAWFSTSTGDDSVNYVAGAVINDDEFDFELYYDEEGSGSSVSPSTHIVLCPV